MKIFGIPGTSFSWKRALGISALKGKISKAIGVPLTESGREKKIGSTLLKGVGLKKDKRKK